MGLEYTSTGSSEIMIVRSFDNGFTFEAPINLSSNTGPSMNQVLIASDENV
ncbi:hypothetical protein [Candidatus Nitrosocosmicus sp. R]